ncbi:MAG: ribose 5-phosphate isomerase B [Fibrobacterota bacterium]
MQNTTPEKIIVGSDHGGFALKKLIISKLSEIGIETEDAGAFTASSPSDYPDYGLRVAEKVASGEFDRGIAICTTGIGMSISVNRVKGIRGTLCLNEDMALFSRKHNNSNVLVLASKYTSEKEAAGILRKWLSTEFDGGRHINRIKKLN